MSKQQEIEATLPAVRKSWMQLAIEVVGCPNDCKCHWKFCTMGAEGADMQEFVMAAGEIRANALQEIMQFLPKTQEDAREFWELHQRSTHGPFGPMGEHPLRDLLSHCLDTLEWKKA